MVNNSLEVGGRKYRGVESPFGQNSETRAEKCKKNWCHYENWSHKSFLGDLSIGKKINEKSHFFKKYELPEV